jgi:hypothetical protein
MMWINHHLLAWAFDDAIGTWGRWVEGELEVRDKKGKRVNHLEDYLGIPRVTKKMTRGELDYFKGLK